MLAQRILLGNSTWVTQSSSRKRIPTMLTRQATGMFCMFACCVEKRIFLKKMVSRVFGALVCTEFRVLSTLGLSWPLNPKPTHLPKPYTALNPQTPCLRIFGGKWSWQADRLRLENAQMRRTGRELVLSWLPARALQAIYFALRP